MPPKPSGPPPKSRRRGEALEHAILEAAWDELSEVGYARLNFEAVAARAGTSKPVIYRRWPTRAALVFAARMRYAPTVPEPEDTGDLRGDLLAWISGALNRHGDSSRDAIAGLITDAFRNPDLLDELRTQLNMSALSSHVLEILERAAARGEVPTADLPKRVLRLPVDLMRNEMILYGRGLSDAAVEEMVDDVLIPLFKSGGS